MNPSLAVIVPVRNGMPFLAEAVDSIFTQSFAPLHVVLVDDGSTDGTAEFASNLVSPQLQLISTANPGPAAARNAGIRATSSDLVAFLDADDIWPQDALHALTAALTRNPTAQFARGRIRNFRGSQPGERHFLTSPYRFINLGATLWRRSLLEQVGLLDEDLHLCEDLDLMLRCWEQDIEKIEIDDIVLHYRRHSESMTHGLTPSTFGTLKAYKKRVDRIRSGAFDPGTPRLCSQQLYIGTPPIHQDGGLHASLA